MQLGIERGVAVPAPIVKLNDFFQTRDAAVVHVGGGSSNLAQRRRLEGAAICFFVRHDEAAQVEPLSVAPGNARVVELLVGEIGANVTGGAVGLAAKQLQPA